MVVVVGVVVNDEVALVVWVVDVVGVVVVVGEDVAVDVGDEVGVVTSHPWKLPDLNAWYISDSVAAASLHDVPS